MQAGSDQPSFAMSPCPSMKKSTLLRWASRRIDPLCLAHAAINRGNDRADRARPGRFVALHQSVEHGGEGRVALVATEHVGNAKLASLDLERTARHSRLAEIENSAGAPDAPRSIAAPYSGRRIHWNFGRAIAAQCRSSSATGALASKVIQFWRLY
ncbi:hypothetical protein ACVW0J_009511 [Bradyrhizobium sp. i1.7.7]